MPLVTSNGIDIPFTSSADQLVAESKRVIAELDKISAKTKERRKAMEEAARAEQSSLGKSRSSWTELNSAVMLGKQAVEAVKKAYSFAREGAQIDFLQGKFDNLSRSIGTTSATLMGDLRDATKGTLSDMELMASVTDLVGLGLANSHDEAVRLAKVSAGLGMNMNQLVLTLTNMTTMRFDALNVRVDGFKDKVKALEDQGYSADAAFKEAFLQQAEAQLLTVGNAADSALGSFMKLEAAGKNISDSLKDMAGDALAEDVGRLAWQLTNVKDIAETMVNLRKGGAGGRFFGLLDMQDLQIAAEARVELLDQRAALENLKDEYPGAAQAVDNMGVSLEDAEQTAKEYAEQLKVISDENKEFIGTLEKVAGNLDKYKEGLAEADAKLAAGDITTKEHAATVAALAGQYEEASKRIVASLLEMKYMADGTFTDEEMVQYMLGLEKLGLITEEDRQATLALYQEATNLHTELGAGAQPMNMYDTMLERLGGRSEDAREEFISMKESQAELAESLRKDAVPAVGALNVALANIKDQQVYVDIYFREHGGSGATFTAPAIGGGAGYQTGIHLEGAGRAAGGPLADGWTVVGDAPGGRWTPYTEVVAPWGYVYDAKTSKAMKDSGMLDGAMALAGGGSVGGRSPVTGSGRAGSGSTGGRNPKTNPGTAPRSSGQTSGTLTGAQAEADAQETAALLAPELEQASNTAAAIGASQQMTARQQNDLIAETNELLRTLIAKTPGATDMARANTAAQSKFS